MILEQANNHISREEFILEFCNFYGKGRDLGNPWRRYTRFEGDILPFIENCTNNHEPAFISVQPMQNQSNPSGIEKLFFDFDYVDKTFEKNLAVEEPDEIKRQTILEKQKAEMVNEVRLFLKQINSLGIKPLVVKTRKGYHIHIYFDSVYMIGDKLDFFREVYKQLQLRFLQYHNFKYLDPVIIGDMNRLCRIPFSIHEKSGEECIIVNNELKPDKIRSLEYFKLYGLKQTDLWIAVYAAKNVKAYRKNPILKKNIIPLDETGNLIKQIRPCFKKGLDAGEMCHAQRLALLSEAYCNGCKDPESMTEVFRSFNDFSERTTQYQVNYFFKKIATEGDVRPYKCKTITEKNWCLKEQCPKWNFRA